MENITVKCEVQPSGKNMIGEHNKCHLRSDLLPRIKKDVEEYLFRKV